MPLISADLAQQLVSNVKGISDATVAHNAYASTIKEYLETNLTWSGTYSGFVPAGSADPNSGSYTWTGCSIPIMTGALLQTGTAGGMVGWAAAITTGIMTGMISTTPDNESPVGLAANLAATAPSISVSIVPTATETTFEEMASLIANSIVTAITTSIPIPATGVGTSLVGGGPVTILTLS